MHKAALSKLKCCTPNFCPGLGLLPPLSHPMQLPDLWQVPCSAALPQLLLSFSSFCAPFLPARSLLLSVTHQQWPEHVIFLICGQSSSSANAAAVGSAFKPSLFQGFGWHRLLAGWAALSPRVTGTARLLSALPGFHCLSNDSNGRQPGPYPGISCFKQFSAQMDGFTGSCFGGSSCPCAGSRELHDCVLYTRSPV